MTKIYRKSWKSTENQKTIETTETMSNLELGSSVQLDAVLVCPLLDLAS